MFITIQICLTLIPGSAFALAHLEIWIPAEPAAFLGHCWPGPSSQGPAALAPSWLPALQEQLAPAVPCQLGLSSALRRHQGAQPGLGPSPVNPSSSGLPPLT